VVAKSSRGQAWVAQSEGPVTVSGYATGSMEAWEGRTCVAETQEGRGAATEGEETWGPNGCRYLELFL
jgi:hypothetical protein